MRVYIGYDEREHEAYEVCRYSLEKHTPNVDVRPLVQSQLREQDYYWREKDEAATAFSLLEPITAPTPDRPAAAP